METVNLNDECTLAELIENELIESDIYQEYIEDNQAKRFIDFKIDRELEELREELLEVSEDRVREAIRSALAKYIVEDL